MPARPRRYLRGEATATGIRLADGTAIIAGAGTGIVRSGQASCAVRPERIRISASTDADDGSGNRLTGRVAKRIFAGNSSTYFVERDGHMLKVLVQNDGGERFNEGETVVLGWPAESTVFIRPYGE